MKIKNQSNYYADVIIPSRKRTIIITKKLAKFYNLPTNKLFVQFPELNFCIYFSYIDKIFYLNHNKRISAKIINPKSDFKFFQFTSSEICLGKEYHHPLTNRKINDIISRFFNSRFHFNTRLLR